jgi:hypothetical protein
MSLIALKIDSSHHQDQPLSKLPQQYLAQGKQASFVATSFFEAIDHLRGHWKFHLTAYNDWQNDHQKKY